jgi:hypothetical protein
MKGELKDRSQASLIFTEARLLTQDLHCVKIKKIPRSANSDAHLLAAYCGTNSCNGVMFDSAPECVREQAFRDCNPDTII